MSQIRRRLQETEESSARTEKQLEITTSRLTSSETNMRHFVDKAADHSAQQETEIQKLTVEVGISNGYIFSCNIYSCGIPIVYTFTRFSHSFHSSF